jgi:hypothetical protein
MTNYANSNFIDLSSYFEEVFTFIPIQFIDQKKSKSGVNKKPLTDSVSGSILSCLRSENR